ncbi:Hypothetical predicted protein [Cloeon dipterum]|uniref:Myb/SANT-like DNA-binding domain-containing protein n=1 Tax=Cloeon dipterum TaxID=197152 RepID=A0A8S1C4A7_9INSE|nr:Hypothetical predicted protein [Cloeon dipterum]
MEDDMHIDFLSPLDEPRRSNRNWTTFETIALLQILAKERAANPMKMKKVAFLDDVLRQLHAYDCFGRDRNQIKTKISKLKQQYREMCASSTDITYHFDKRFEMMKLAFGEEILQTLEEEQTTIMLEKEDEQDDGKDSNWTAVTDMENDPQDQYYAAQPTATTHHGNKEKLSSFPNLDQNFEMQAEFLKLAKEWSMQTAELTPMIASMVNQHTKCFQANEDLCKLKKRKLELEVEEKELTIKILRTQLAAKLGPVPVVPNSLPTVGKLANEAARNAAPRQGAHPSQKLVSSSPVISVSNIRQVKNVSISGNLPGQGVPKSRLILTTTDGKIIGIYPCNDKYPAEKLRVIKS